MGFKVTEKSMAKGLSLPQIGERLYKGQALGEANLNFFLKPEYHNPSWTKGVPKDWLREKWQKVLIVVQRYLTCEGRFHVAHLLHMRFLCHIFGYKSLNLPYFLHTNLLKMLKKIQAKLDSPPHLIYHSGLIKILVKSTLDRKYKSWDRFIIEEGFTSLTEKNKLGRPIKSVKNMQSPISPNPQIVAE